MKANKIYIRETGQTVELGGQGGGAGTAINVYRFNYSHREDGKDNRLFIRCNKGALLESDTLLFVRSIKNKTGKIGYQEEGDEQRRYIYHGWIIPRAPWYIDLELHFIETKDNFDIWEITPNYEGFHDWVNLGLALYEGELDKGECHINLSRRCGAIVVRDGVMVTSPICFRVHTGANESTGESYAALGR